MSQIGAPEGVKTDDQIEEVGEVERDTDAEDREAAEADTEDGKPRPPGHAGGIRWSRVVAYGVLPAAALLLALGAGYAKWLAATLHFDPGAGAQAVEAGTNGAIAMLSYQYDTADEDLLAASDWLTGEFKDAYTTLVTDVVIPGAQEQQISAVSSVPAAAPVSVTDNAAVVVVFVNQTTTVGNNPPTDLASTVRVTLDKVDDRWLISKFEPI